MAEIDPAAAEPQEPHVNLQLPGAEAAFEKAFAAFDKGGDDDEAPPAETSAELEELPTDDVEGDEAADDGKPAATETETPATDDEAYERALLELRYHHGKAADIIIKNASREELIALGTEAADRRASQRAALEERAEKIRKLEAATTAPVAPAKPAPTDWSPHLKILAEKLGLDLEDAKAAFGPMLDAVAQQTRTEVEGRISNAEKASQESAAAEGRRQMSEQVQRLSETYPRLKSDEKLIAALNSKALTLAKAARDEGTPYRSAQALYDDAERLVLAGKVSTAALGAKRRNGSAPPPEGRVHDGPIDSDDAWQQAVDAAERGDKRGVARAAAHVSFAPPGRRTPKK